MEWERAKHLDIPALKGFRIDAELKAACKKRDETRPETPYHLWYEERVMLLWDEKLRRKGQW
jgi:hypothetical protein